MRKKRYAILLGDGMADLPIESLGNRTPLTYANTPNMDSLARTGILGLARTIPEGMPPGSDVANLSVLGYDPQSAYTGRAPLEALNMGIQLSDNDVAFRCNIVDIRKGIMHDFSAGHVASELSRVIMEELSRQVLDENIEFHPGVSYRNIVVWRDYPYAAVTESTPPHDIHEEPAAQYLPRGEGSEKLISIMKKSESIIADSSAIRNAMNIYKGSPVSVWLWGGGRKPSVDTLQKRYGLTGYTISAVDLIHGLGRAAGLSPWPVEGATGYIDTNYIGKAEALLQGLRETDIVFLHVESPDESGHEGNLDHKIQAIEDFDKKVVGTVMEGISDFDDYSLMVLPDHPTPVSLRTHTADPIPFCIYNSQGWDDTSFNNYRGSSFSEASAAETGLMLNEGFRILELMIMRRL